MHDMSPSFDDGVDISGDLGYAIEEAYLVDGAINLECPTCRARVHEWCEKEGQTKKIPHTSRLGLAYRTNHPRGRRKHAARVKHLAKHEKTYKPSWKTDERKR